MISLPTLRTVVRLKERRVAEQAEVVKAAKDQLVQRVQELNDALGEEARLRADEQARHDKLFNTSTRTQGFRGSDIVTLQHLLSDAQQRTLAAGTQVRKAEQQVEAARGQVQVALQGLQRAERRLEQRRDQMTQLQDHLARQQEDQQDEEAEEAAVARMLAAARTRPAAGRAAA
jgi:chromosome segregation ATPase